MEQSGGDLMLEIMHGPSSPEDGIALVISEVRPSTHLRLLPFLGPLLQAFVFSSDVPEL